MDGVHFGPKVNANLFRRQISPLQSYAQTKISDNPLTSLYHQASKFVHTCTVMAGSVADTLNSAGKSIQETASSMSGEALSSAASFGSRMQNTVADSAQEIWNIIFSVKESTVSTKHVYVDPNKVETKSWTDDTTTFNLALIGKIDPKSKGAFRVGGVKTEVLQRVDTQNIDHGVLSEASRKSATPPNSETITEAASSTLKESLRQRPLYDRGEAMQKTNHLINEEGEFVGTPEETYKALTSSLSLEKKQVFDQLLGLFSEVVANKEINSMPLSNLAIAFGPTLFPEGSSEGLSMMDGIAFAAENTKRQTALFGKLVEYAESQNAADQVEETPAEVTPEAVEATPEAGRVFTDEGLKARIASLEAKENKSLKEIEPAKVYTALTEGLSGEQKELFDGEIESLRNEAKSTEVNGKHPYEEMKALDAQLPRMSLVVQLIQTESIRNTPLGISDRSVESFETNKTLVDKLLRAGS